MEKLEVEYTEINGLLHPNIEIDGKEELDNLGKYGRLHLNYLHEQKTGMYRELLLTVKLVKHCTAIDRIAFEMAECIYITKQAQMLADEIVMMEYIYT